MRKRGVNKDVPKLAKIAERAFLPIETAQHEHILRVRGESAGSEVGKEWWWCLTIGKTLKFISTFGLRAGGLEQTVVYIIMSMRLREEWRCPYR